MSSVRLWRMALALIVHCCVLAVPAQQAAGDRVAGQVVSATDAHPLPHAAVTLYNLQTNRLAFSFTADDEGRYNFEAVPPGKYRLSGNARGYFASAYDAHQNLSTAIVTGAGLATDSLLLRLTPLSGMTGRIIDEAGDPVQHANVQLYREEPEQGNRVVYVRNALTQADGIFEFSRLFPGKFYLAASGMPWYAVHPRDFGNGNGYPYKAAVDPAVDVAYPLTFYPHALSSDEASPIELHGGEQMALDMTLAAVPAVTLSVRMPQGQRPGGGGPQAQLVQSVFGMDEGVIGQQISIVDGSEHISGLAPGQYKLKQVTMSGMEVGGSSVDLSSGSASIDSTGPSELATVQVNVHAAHGGPLPAHLQLGLRTTPPRSMVSQNANDAGIVTIANVPPGDYRLALNAPGPQISMRSLTVDGRPVPSKVLHVAGTGTLKVDLTIDTETVEVSGFATRGGQAAPGALIVLVPAGGDSSESLFRRDQSDLDGSFVFHGVVPGKYIVVAIDDGWQLRWDDVNAVLTYLPHGVPVIVPENSKEPVRIAEKVATQPR